MNDYSTVKPSPSQDNLLTQPEFSAQLIQAAELFRNLGNPSRLRILYSLLEQSLTVSEISNAVGTTLSNTSHQLRLLQTARLIKSQREGKYIHYSLDDEHIRILMQTGLDHIQHK
jgi:ArsR family transcriptional regulator, lead/cadmium/zinc/bismuth-responsive transcriptional repressor